MTTSIERADVTAALQGDAASVTKVLMWANLNVDRFNSILDRVEVRDVRGKKVSFHPSDVGELVQEGEDVTRVIMKSKWQHVIPLAHDELHAKIYGGPGES